MSVSTVNWNNLYKIAGFARVGAGRRDPGAGNALRLVLPDVERSLYRRDGRDVTHRALPE